MKLNEKKRRIEQEVPLDPVLLAASVPARKPTAKDLADCKERPTDAIETISFSPMKTRTITEAKNALGRLADAALRGKPTVISRGGKLVVLQAFSATEPPVSHPPGYFADCYIDPAEIDLENRCGRASD